MGGARTAVKKSLVSYSSKLSSSFVVLMGVGVSLLIIMHFINLFSANVFANNPTVCHK